MGIYILYQFLYKRHQTVVKDPSTIGRYAMIPQGAVAGFLDAIGGGGWGPVNTPLLLAQKKLEPRYAIGTVSASEFLSLFQHPSVSLSSWDGARLTGVSDCAKYWWFDCCTFCSMVS